MAEAATLGLLGKKLGMRQLFDDEGNRIAVTVVQGGPSVITQIKTPAKEGYSAVQLGFEPRSEKRLSKALRGHFNKHNVAPRRQLREFRLDPKAAEELKVGQEVGVEGFKSKDCLDVTGISKGKGFAGVMKRYGFAGFPATHGTHEYFRHGGSIGCCFPQHTIKGKKMPGRMGGKRVTVQNLEVFDVKPEENLLFIKGALPGAKGGYLYLRKAVKTAS